MQKILILGSQGSGKSHLARQLGQALRIPVFHLDEIFWETWGPPHNVNPSKEEVAQKITGLLCGDAWVIDGNFRATLPQRLSACDTVIYLKTPPLICIWRVIYRSFKRRFAGPLRVFEKVNLQLVRHIWQFSVNQEPKITATINDHIGSAQLIALTSKNEISQFIQAAKL